MSVEQALAVAVKTHLEDVLILGYDEENNLVVISSRQHRERSLWTLEAAKLHVLRPMLENLEGLGK